MCIEDLNVVQSHNVFMLCNNCMCLLCLTGGATATPSQDANITDLCRVLNKSQSAKTLDPTLYLVTYIFFFYLRQTLFAGLIPYPPMRYVHSVGRNTTITSEHCYHNSIVFLCKLCFRRTSSIEDIR